MRRLGFISVNDPDAARVAILPGNGTLEEMQKALGVPTDRYAPLAAGQAIELQRAKQLIPGIDNQYLVIGGLALLALAVVIPQRRR